MSAETEEIINLSGHRALSDDHCPHLYRRKLTATVMVNKFVFNYYCLQMARLINKQNRAAKWLTELGENIAVMQQYSGQELF